MSIFETLNAINVNGHTETREVLNKQSGKKVTLTYLSWAWAWAEIKKAYPDATYTVYERPDGVIYWTDGKTCWVKTGLTIEGLEHIEYLPVMDYANRSILLENVTSMDVNKAIQRSLTKAAARHGLGLYIYAGEDLPEEEAKSEKPAEQKAEKPTETAPVKVEKNDNIAAVNEYLASVKMPYDVFKRYWKACVDNGYIDKVPLDKLTPEGLQTLINFVEANRGG